MYLEKMMLEHTCKKVRYIKRYPNPYSGWLFRQIIGIRGSIVLTNSRNVHILVYPSADLCGDGMISRYGRRGDDTGRPSGSLRYS
jgi:hypothetical protein